MSARFPTRGSQLCAPAAVRSSGRGALKLLRRRRPRGRDPGRAGRAETEWERPRWALRLPAPQQVSPTLHRVLFRRGAGELPGIVPRRVKSPRHCTWDQPPPAPASQVVPPQTHTQCRAFTHKQLHSPPTHPVTSSGTQLLCLTYLVTRTLPHRGSVIMRAIGLLCWGECGRPGPNGNFAPCPAACTAVCTWWWTHASEHTLGGF